MSSGPLHLRACAKVNLGLEVLGRRPDGFHDIVSILQTIALWDDVELSTAASDRLTVEAPAGWDVPRGEENLAWRALMAYRAAGGSPGSGIHVRLEKRVPAAAGLGGGSADAAAVLRGLEAVAPKRLGPSALASLAGVLGSDVPFFLRGGTQLAEGRGDRLTPLPDIGERWLLLVDPPLNVEQKTARLFGMLEADDFTGGARVRRIAAAIGHGHAIDYRTLTNAFTRVAGQAFPGLDRFRDALASVCGHAVLSGSGPSLFALAANQEAAYAAATLLSVSGVPARAVRTMGAEDSTLIY